MHTAAVVPARRVLGSKLDGVKPNSAFRCTFALVFRRKGSGSSSMGCTPGWMRELRG
jgi:hypothetical protein